MTDARLDPVSLSVWAFTLLWLPLFIGWLT